MALKELAGQQLTILLLVAIGYFACKGGILTKSGVDSLIRLVVNLVLPCNIVRSFLIVFRMEMLFSFGAMLLISLIIQGVSVLFAYTLYNRAPPDKKGILQFSTICSNAAFLDNPVAESFYGAMGLSYASIYLIPQRIIMWTVGVSFFTCPPDKKAVLKTILTHPCIVAVFVGLACMFTQVPLPGVAVSTIRYLGDCCTPLSMLVIGASLVDVDHKTLLDKTTLYYSLIRLVVIPLLALLGCRLFGVDPVVTGVAVLLTAMPAGATTAIMAAQYKGNTAFASKCILLTTVASLFTTLLWGLVLAL